MTPNHTAHDAWIGARVRHAGGATGASGQPAVADAGCPRFAAWRRMVDAVDRVRDRLGKPVDPGIRGPVAALNLLGFPTSQSCEGHVNLRGHGLAAPWVDFADDDSPADLPDRLRALLDRFYAGREVRPDLRLRYCGLRRRLSNGGSFEELDDLRCRLAEGRSTPAETQRERHALADRQDEMRRFTRFLLRGEPWLPGARSTAEIGAGRTETVFGGPELNRTALRPCSEKDASDG